MPRQENKDKYEWITLPGEKGRRPLAKKDFGCVKEGDIGALFDEDSNLSQVDLCWAEKDCVITEGTKIAGNAIIKGNSSVCGSIVNGKSTIENNSRIYGSFITDSAVSNSIVANSEIYDNAEIKNSVVRNTKVLKTQELYKGPAYKSSIITDSYLNFCELTGEGNKISDNCVLRNASVINSVWLSNSVTKIASVERYANGDSIFDPTQNTDEFVFSGNCKIVDSKFKGNDIIIRNKSLMIFSNVIGNHVEISHSHISNNVSVKDNVTILNSSFISVEDSGFSVGIRRSIPIHKNIMFNNACVESENDFFIFEVSPNTFTTLYKTTDVENFKICHKGRTFFDYNEVRKYILSRFETNLNEEFKRKYNFCFISDFLFEHIVDVETNIEKQIQKIETETGAVFTNEEKCRLTAIIFLNMTELAGKSIHYLFSTEKHRWYKGGPNRTYSAIKMFCSSIPFDIKNKEQIETTLVYLTEETIKYLKKTSKISDDLLKSECFLVLR